MILPTILPPVILFAGKRSLAQQVVTVINAAGQSTAGVVNPSPSPGRNALGTVTGVYGLSVKNILDVLTLQDTYNGVSLALILHFMVSQIVEHARDIMLSQTFGMLHARGTDLRKSKCARWDNMHNKGWGCLSGVKSAVE